MLHGYSYTTRCGAINPLSTHAAFRGAPSDILEGAKERMGTIRNQEQQRPPLLPKAGITVAALKAHPSCCVRRESRHRLHRHRKGVARSA